MLIRADARRIPIADESIDCVVTSPPYWGLRDYKCDGQIGLEDTPQEYVETMRAVFMEIRRVLKATGTAWLNLGDSYAGSGKGPSNEGSKQRTNLGSLMPGQRNTAQFASGQAPTKWLPIPLGLKAKDLVGIPWRVAFALQADGWWLRSDIIWHKPNPMPESITDRPTKAHEYVFLLAKSQRYYYDAEAIKEKAIKSGEVLDYAGGQKTAFKDRTRVVGPTRNARSVWAVASQGIDAAHFAPMPPRLAKRCILAGCPPGGIVLDPFCGTGTTVKVAKELGRRGIGIDLSAEYLHCIADRRTRTQRGFAI